jgi:hypothetical protein
MLKNCKIIGADVNPVGYHQSLHARGTLEHPMSSSSLRNFGHCPLRYFRGYNPPESKAKDFGSVLDCLLLTPKQFPARYAVQPGSYESKGMECPECGSVTDSKTCSKCKCSRREVTVTKDWSNQSTTCAAWTKEQIDAGREVVTEDTVLECTAAIARLQEDEILTDFIELSDKQVLIKGEWHDEKTGLIIPVQCLIDLAPRKDTEFAACLGDFKSTRTAALMAFQRDAFKYGYHVQAAFDFALWNAATAQERNTWCFVLQESYEPWQTGRRMLSQDFLTLGVAEYTRLLGNYCACLKSGKWPSYEDTDEGSVQGWSLLEPNEFDSMRQQFAPKFNFDEAGEVEVEVTDEDVTP